MCFPLPVDRVFMSEKMTKIGRRRNNTFNVLNIFQYIRVRDLPGSRTGCKWPCQLVLILKQILIVSISLLLLILVLYLAFGCVLELSRSLIVICCIDWSSLEIYYVLYTAANSVHNLVGIPAVSEWHISLDSWKCWIEEYKCWVWARVRMYWPKDNNYRPLICHCLNRA